MLTVALIRPTARRPLFSLATVAVLSTVMAGCIEPPPVHHLTLVEGTGYATTVWEGNLSSELADAAMSPDRTMIALLYLNGTVEVRLFNGSLVSSWETYEAPLDCDEDRGCGLEFLPNGTLLGYTQGAVAIYATNGSVLWSWSPSALSQGLLVVEAGGNGTVLVIGYNNQSAEVRNIHTGVTFPLPVEGQGLLWDVSASTNTDVAATGSGIVAFYNGGLRLPAQAERYGDVEVSADGLAAFVWGRHGADPHDLIRVNLTTFPSPLQNITVRDARIATSIREVAESRLFISPAGRFAALRAQVSLTTCSPGTAPCHPRAPHDYVRVFDAQEPSGDYGFTANHPVRVFLEDDGSAFAVATVRVASHVYQLEFTTASPRATPPHGV